MIDAWPTIARKTEISPFTASDARRSRVLNGQVALNHTSLPRRHHAAICRRASARPRNRTKYTYAGSSHRLSSLSGATSRSFTYDAAGNLTASAGVTYTYDGRGRMKQAGSATYLVNGLGQRVRKTAGAQTHFAYDEAGRLLGEYDSTGAAIQEYVWLGDLPVAVVRPASPGGFTAYYVWADHLGTPRVVSDAANVVRWEWANANPFGAHAPDDNPSGAGAFTLNLRFPGQYFDQETGLHYNYFRDFDPSVGRYIQSDPIGLLGGVNTFGYVSANPLTSVDLLGLAECTYSIGRHSLSCKPNPGSGGSGGSVTLGPNGLTSGAGPCRDNPSNECQDSKNRGPIPEGDYDVLPYDGRNEKGHNWWRLRPQSIVRRAVDGVGLGRGGHLLHPGTISLGCITYFGGDSGPYDRLNILLRRDQPNTLRVTP